MENEKNIQLINKQIDGLISEPEKLELQKIMKDNPEVRRLYDELCQTADLLSDADELEPSENLKKYIMNSIDADLYKESKEKSSKRLSFFSFPQFPKYRLSLVFATGLVAGIFIYSTLLVKLFNEESINTIDLTGTIGANESLSFTNIKSFPVETPEINGEINIKSAVNIFVFNVDLNASKELTLLIEFKPDQVRFNNFVPHLSNEYLINKGENYVKTTCNGDIKFDVYFNPLISDKTDVHIKLLSSGITVFSRELSISDKK